MFLNYMRDFFVKKTLNNNLNKFKSEVFTSNVQTIGLLVDESDFQHSEALINELVLQGIAPESIKIVAYKSKFKEKETYSKPTFGKKHINWKGNIEAEFLLEFTETKFDLLISYYDIENNILMMVTSESKAKFKVGFSSIDPRLNRLMINTTLENYKLFIFELFKYLKNIK